MNKGYTRRFFAALMAASMLMNQSGFTSYSYAEEVQAVQVAETVAEPETPAPQPETPAPEPETPAPEPETPAPQPETPAPEPETPAPAPEPETPAPQPETPAPEPETPAPAMTETPTESATSASTEGATEPAQTEQAASEAASEAKTEKATEAQTEKTTEESTEKKDKTTLKGEFDGGTITVTLSENDAVTKKGRLRVRQVADPSAFSAIRELTDKGHRELAGGLLYYLTLKDSGEQIIPADPVKIEISYASPQSLGLVPYHLEQTALYSDSIIPVEVPGEIALNGDLCVTAVSYQGTWVSELTVAGICDHINDGAAVTSGQIRAHVNNIPSGYYAAAGSAQGAGDVPVGIVTVDGLNAGTQKEPEGAAEAAEEEKAASREGEDSTEAAKEESEPKAESEEAAKPKKNLPDAGAVSAGLADLATYSVQLANAVNGGDVMVVNVYADADGNIDWTPLTPAMNGDAIDVSGQMVLINIAAYTPGQALSIPAWGVKDQATAGAEYSAEDAVRRKGGRVIYNFVSQGEEREPSGFAGSISVEGAGTGMYLAPSAALNIASGLRGSAYAGTLIVSDGTPIAGCLIGDDPVMIRQGAAAAEAEKEKKEAEAQKTEAEGETESITEGLSEGTPEDVTERPDVVLVGIGAEKTADETAEEEAETLEATPEELELALRVFEGDSPVAEAEGFAVDVTATKEDGTLIPFKVSDLPTDESGKLLVSPLVGESRIPSMDLLMWTEVEPAEGEKAAWKTELTVKVTLPGAYNPAESETLIAPFVITRTLKQAEESETGQGEDPPVPAYDYTIAPQELDGDRIDVVSKTALTIPVSVVEYGDEEKKQLNDAEFTVTLGDTVIEGVKLVSGGDENEVTLYLEDYRKNDKVTEFLANLAAGDEMAPPLAVTVTQTKTVLLYDFASPDSQAAPVSVSNYYEEKEGEKVRVNEYEMNAFEFQLNPTTLTLTPYSDVNPAEAKYTDQTGASNYPSGQTQSYVLKDTEPFKSITESSPSATIWVRETTVPAGYVCTNPEQTVTATINAKGVITWDGAEDPADKKVDFKHAPKQLTVTMKAVNRSGKGLPASFKIRDASGNWISDATGKSVFEYDGNGNGVTAVFNNVSSVTIVQTGVPENYFIVGEAAQTKTEGTDYTYSATDGKASCDAVFTNATAATTKESIRVRKEWYVGDNNRVYKSAGDGVTFYLALFSDKAKTNRVSQVYPVTAARGNPYKTKTIGHLPEGTYYVAETDVNGVPIISDSSIAYVSYESDADGKVTIKNTGSTVHNVTVKNHYYSLPADFQYLGQLGIRVQMLTEKGELDTTFDGSVKVQIRYNSGGKTLAQTKTLSVSKGKSSYYAYYVPLGTETSKEVSIYEAYTGTNGKTYYAADGKRVRLNGKIYTVSFSSPTVTVASAQTSTPLVTVANTAQASDPSGDKESESGGDASQAVLKLTKKVTYKGQPVRVNSGYYIGIFDDAGLTKLRYKKALAFKNASEVTASLKINLYKLKSKEVTFYFAEVDKDGKPVESGGASGYNISQNKQSITLNEKNLEDEVIITNDVVSGSRREKALTDPKSGFAGSAAAAAEAAAISSSEDAEQAANSSARTKTGDGTPIALYVGLLAAALVIILLAIFLIRRRRR